MTAQNPLQNLLTEKTHAYESLSSDIIRGKKRRSAGALLACVTHASVPLPWDTVVYPIPMLHCHAGYHGIPHANDPLL